MGLMAPETGTAPAGGGDGGAKVTVGGPEAVFGGSAPTPAPSVVPTTESQETPAPEGQGATPAAQPQTPATNPPVAMTEEQLAKLAQTIAASHKPAPQTQPDTNRPLTPEEQAQFDREFNVVRVTPETFTSILGFAPENPQQLKALENFAHGIVRQAAAMTMFQVQQMAQERQKALEGRLAPVLQTHQEQAAASLEQKFFTKHPDLKDFGALIQEVALAEKARGTQFKSPEEAIDFVANKARALLGNRASSGTTQTSTATNGKQPTKPSMPTTSVGGRSGSSGSPQPASGPKAVFGDLDGSR